MLLPHASQQKDAHVKILCSVTFTLFIESGNVCFLVFPLMMKDMCLKLIQDIKANRTL